MGWADEYWVLSAAYLLVALLCLVGWRHDTRSASARWPLFWPMAAALLALMAVGRGGQVAETVRDLLRDRAHDGGWYRRRRPWQAVGVLVLGVVWAGIVFAAFRRHPERRAQFLPTTLCLLSLGTFVAVRVVSLHQVDAVLEGHHITGVRLGTALEYALLGLTAASVIAGELRSSQR